MQAGRGWQTRPVVAGRPGREVPTGNLVRTEPDQLRCSTPAPVCARSLGEACAAPTARGTGTTRRKARTTPPGRPCLASRHARRSLDLVRLSLLWECSG